MLRRLEVAAAVADSSNTVGQNVRRVHLRLPEEGLSGAQVLVSAALDWSITDVVLRRSQSLTGDQLAAVERFVERRLTGEPLAYIEGVREFYGRRFRVDPRVLIPRPETEHLVEEALACFEGGVLVDVGTGSGAVAITLALETTQGNSTVLGCDLSAGALEVARGNAQELGARRIHWLQSDLLSGVSATTELAGVVANLPYVASHDVSILPRDVVEFEPSLALYPQGRSVAGIRRALLQQACRRLRRDGFVALEVGAGQAGQARDDLLAEGFRQVTIGNDLAGIGRIVAGRKR